MTIYLKDWDVRKTSLTGRKTILKSSKIISAIGSIDEISSYLGIIISESKTPPLNKILIKVQINLYQALSITAGANNKFSKDKVIELESLIKQTELNLPRLRNFLLPGGCKTASRLMYARAKVRSTEREFVGIYERLKNDSKEQILKYFDRLSDLLFVLARQENYRAGVKEKSIK